MFGIEVGSKYLTAVADLHHIERMELVLTTDVDGIVAVLEDKDNTRFQVLVGRNNRVHTKRRVLHVMVLFEVR